MRFLYDTAVFLYARGSDHPYRQPCRAIVEAGGRGELAGEASTELVQEYVYVRLRRGGLRRDVADEARAVLGLCRNHPVEPEDTLLALTLLVSHDALSPRDTLHAATALRRGIPAIVTPDRAFDHLDGLERLDPTVALERLTRT